MGIRCTCRHTAIIRVDWSTLHFILKCRYVLWIRIVVFSANFLINDESSYTCPSHINCKFLVACHTFLIGKPCLFPHSQKITLFTYLKTIQDMLIVSMKMTKCWQTYLCFRSDIDTLQFQMTFEIPHIRVKAQYRSSGVLILVKASGSGEYWGEYGKRKNWFYYHLQPNHFETKNLLTSFIVWKKIQLKCFFFAFVSHVGV